MSATNRSQHRQRGTGRGTPATALQLRHEAAVAASTSPAPGYTRTGEPAVTPGYGERASKLAREMRTYIGSCERCANPVYEHPGYCVQCAWDDGGEVA